MRNVVRSLILAMAGVLLLASTSFGAGMSCAKMQVTSIGQNNVWLKNVSGATCGGIIANGASQYFVFNQGTNDRLLAITLTAMSLNKVVWVHAAGATKGSIIDIISLAK